MPAPSDHRAAKKDRVLRVLTKLNDRDTQKAAAEELLSIVSDLDAEGLPIMITCICSTDSQQKVYARKECARALGFIATSACPSRAAALQPPYLGKMLTQLKKAMGDADSSVRETGSEALAIVARGMCEVGLSPGGAGGGGGGGAALPPVLRVISDCLAEGRKEVQAAACVALGLAAPYIGPVDSALVKDLIRKSQSPSFHAPATLLAAIARCDAGTGLPEGLMKASTGSFAPLLPTLIGQPAVPSTSSPGSGVLGALASKDWMLRRAAADLVRACALLYGPLMEAEGCWDAGDSRCLSARCVRALDNFCKFDKVKEVRETARDTLSLLNELQDYGRQGGSSAGWAHVVEQRLGQAAAPSSPTGGGAARASAAQRPDSANFGRRRSPSPRRPDSGSAAVARSRSRRSRSPSPPSRPLPAVRSSVAAAQHGASPPRRESPFKQGSVNDRFKKAHGEEDLVADVGALRSSPSPESSSQQPPLPSADARPRDMLDVTLATPAAGSLSNQASLARTGSAGPRDSGEGGSVTLPRDQVNSMQQQLKEYELRQRELLATMAAMTENYQRTISDLQERVRTLETARSRSASPLASRQDPLLRPGSAAAAGPPDPQFSPEPQLSASASGRWDRDRDSGSSRGRASRYYAPPGGGDSPRASLTTITPTLPPSYLSASQSGGLPPADVDGAYAAALAPTGGGETAASRVLALQRLLQQTGCAWGQLRPGTSQALLQAFVTHVQDGVMRPKILPWLWRLADEGQAQVQVPEDTRQQLLGALTAAAGTAAPDDPQGSQKIQLLAQTLRSYWGAQGDVTGGGGGSFSAVGGTPQADPVPSPSPVRDPSRASWISSQQQELDKLQNEFLSSPHSLAAAANR